MPCSKSAQNRLLATVAAILTVAALRASYAVAMPVAISLLVIAAAWPFKLWLDRFVPAPASYLITIGLLLLILACFMAAVSFSIAQIVVAFASDWDRLAHACLPLEKWLAQWGLSLHAAQGRQWVIGFGQALLSSAYTTLIYLGFIALLVIFGLPQVPALKRKLQAEFAARSATRSSRQRKPLPRRSGVTPP